MSSLKWLFMTITLLLVNFVAAETKTQSSDILESLVIIEVRSKAGSRSGSGFVVDMEGKKYLVTNQHVIDGCDSLSIKTLSNERITPISVGISKSLDLIRMEITNNIPALSIRKDTPVIGDDVAVYGNSDGGGVVTEIKGKVLGIGPNLVEVDAEFVQGNSGCPILSDSLEVVAVASYATLFDNPENWLSKDTRFQKVRRYGYRLDSAEWDSIAFRQFVDQSKLISDSKHAISMFAITYLSFRHYIQEPTSPQKPSETKTVTERYQDSFGNWQTRVKTVPNDNYQTEYQMWQDSHEAWQMAHQQWVLSNNRFRSIDPNAVSFHNGKLQKKCAEHYKRAKKLFFEGTKWSGDLQYGLDVRRAHKGQLLINIDSIDSLKSIKSTLSKKRFVSDFLGSQADELIEVCDYIIDYHQG